MSVITAHKDVLYNKSIRTLSVGKNMYKEEIPPTKADRITRKIFSLLQVDLKVNSNKK